MSLFQTGTCLYLCPPQLIVARNACQSSTRSITLVCVYVYHCRLLLQYVLWFLFLRSRNTSLYITLTTDLVHNSHGKVGNGINSVFYYLKRIQVLYVLHDCLFIHLQYVVHLYNRSQLVKMEQCSEMFFKSDKCSKASSSIREQCVVTCFFNVFRFNFVCIKEVYLMEVSEIASLCKCCPFKCIKDELIFLLVFEIFFYFFTCIEDELLSLHVYENLRVIFPHIYMYICQNITVNHYCV